MNKKLCIRLPDLRTSRLPDLLFIRLPNFAAIFISLFFACCHSASDKRYGAWKTVGATKDGLHYSSLKQIDTNNVSRLQVAWIWHCGDADTVNHSQIQCNPIIIDGVLYGTSPSLKLFALNAATGKQKWIFDPHVFLSYKFRNFILNNNRGVTYWEDGNDKRVFFGAGSFLFALDANTGIPIASFGNNGLVDLHDGLGRDVHDLYVASTSPGMIYKDLLIMGSRVSEESNAAPGHIRAYDTRTGKQRWIFHTIPQPGEFGYDSWEDPIAWKHIGGVNCWSGFSLDEKRGIVFAPIGSASYDFYGGRRKGAALFSDCLLALDAATGKYKWHFQDVHHDVWDKDIPTPPALVTIVKDGKEIDAVAQPTKTGFVFLLDRETGAPLYPVEEKAVPLISELTGEKLYPTQPFPTFPKSFMRQSFTEADINPLLPDSSLQEVKKRFRSYHTGNQFNPISKNGTVLFPGLDGGAEWGGPAFDPSSKLLFINANEIPWVITIADRKTNAAAGENLLKAGTRLYIQNCMACHGPDRKGSGNYPSILDAAGKYHEDEFERFISAGRRMMPAFKQLSEQEKQALAAFVLNVKSLQQKPFSASSEAVDTFLNLPYTITGYTKFVSKEGYPAITPPWGTLNAINLNTGEIAWKIPFGEYPEFKKKGVITGTENYGGAAVTAGGLLFIAATRDGKFRAFDKLSGKLLWETDLPAPGFATPSVYEVDGRQYVVIACGGGKLGMPSGDSYVAFSLPLK